MSSTVGTKALSQPKLPNIPQANALCDERASERASHGTTDNSVKFLHSISLPAKEGNESASLRRDAREEGSKGGR